MVHGRSIDVTDVTVSIYSYEYNGLDGQQVQVLGVSGTFLRTVGTSR